MPNIMITNKCNLACEYCFANEYVNKFGEGHISEKDFMYFLHWVGASKLQQRIGMIGGEPTIHPEFDRLMDLAKLIAPNAEIVIFTNGLRFDEMKHHLIDSRVHTLVNLNSSATMGASNFKKVRTSLIKACKEGYRTKINLGINLYNPTQDMSEFIEICETLSLPQVRVGITVPNDDQKRNRSAVDYFREMTPIFLRLCYELNKIKCNTRFDCNGIPMCAMKPEELFIFRSYLNKIYTETGNSEVLESLSPRICTPVLDIKQDLTAIRCFGMSSDLRVPVTDFDTPEDMESYFKINTDNLASLIATSRECNDCTEHITGACTGGCLSYKIKEIQEARKVLGEISSRRLSK